MTMRTVLLISLTVLLSLSGIFFAVAEGSPLAGFSLLVALATLFFVDLDDLFAVPPTIANMLGIVAFIVAGFEFFNGEIESRLLAGGHLIVYLTWVFMIQKKEMRHIWWLCALSILQIATASVLTTDIWFGWALIGYSFVATWTMSVFQLYRATQQQTQNANSEKTEDVEAKFIVSDRWKGNSANADYRILNWRFLGISCTMTILGLFLSLLFFLFTPRIWIGQFSFLSDEAMSGRALTGFTDEVRLGDMGEILENNDVVLELQLSHTNTEEPFTQLETEKFLGAEPLFRGTVMELYENGRWKQIGSNNYQRFLRRSRNAPITQTYHVSAIGSPALFSFGDTVFATSLIKDRRLFREQFSDELKRDPEAPLNQDFEYIVQSTRSPTDTTFAEERSYKSRIYRLEFFRVYQRPLRYVPRNLSRVAELAQSLASPEASDMANAQTLEKYFTQSSEFTYSLNLSIKDASIDPLEDFIFNRKTGHCEYYASAMTMMLRAVGIPSRLVSGFKGGSYHPERETYLIRQLHAHSWVEAYIDDRWVTFDPTPATRSESVSELENGKTTFGSIKDRLNSYWTQGVQMSKRQQQELIYRPLQNLGQESWENAKNILQGRTSGLKALLDFLRSPEQWFSLKGGLVAFVLMTIVSGLIWIGRKIWGLLSRLQIEHRMSHNRRRRIEFYERFLKILQTQNLHQRPTQTAREFVESSLSSLKPKLDAKGFPDWSEDFIRMFYDVRFGEQDLPREEAQEIERRLSALEACFEKKKETAK